MKKIFPLILVICLIFSGCTLDLEEAPDNYNSKSTDSYTSEIDRNIPSVETNSDPMSSSQNSSKSSVSSPTITSSLSISSSISSSSSTTSIKPTQSASTQSTSISSSKSSSISNSSSVSNPTYSSSKPTYSSSKPSYSSSKPTQSKSSGNTVTVPAHEETVGNLVWVPTLGGKKYHSRPGCSNMIDPIQVSIETAKANGYTACKRCH